MVLLVHKIYSKLENFHHHPHHHNNDDGQQSQALSASLEAFQTHVSNSLNKLFSNATSEDSEVLSFPWVEQCFQLLPIINDAFAKLVAAIDYPMSNWEGDSVEEYLKYSLNLLEICNSITSSLSHIGKERLSLSHGLSLVESSSPSSAVEHLKPIQTLPKSLTKEVSPQEHEKQMFPISKKSVIHQALAVMEGMLFWVCGTLMPGLVGDSQPCMEMRKSGGRLVNSLISGLELSVGEVIVEKKLKEFKEINDSVTALVSAIVMEKKTEAESEELQRRLTALEKMMEGLEKEVDCLFNKVLAGRNQLVSGFQLHQKH